jgi:hypothetical protein
MPFGELSIKTTAQALKHTILPFAFWNNAYQLITVISHLIASELVGGRWS